MSATILIGEDTEINRVLLERRLKAEGFQVVLAHDGVEVLDKVAATPVDLILLDVMMPKMDGYAVLSRLRQSHPLTQLPVIILTALSDSSSVIEALRLGANDYAIKPVEMGVLLERIRNHLKLKAPENQRIGKYELMQAVGAGAMGSVFAARDLLTGEPVAIKVLPRSLTVSPDGVTRFAREARLLSQIDHPNVVRFLGAGQDGEVHYLVMELVEGKNLVQLAGKNPMPPAIALDVARQIATGLRAIAQLGIIHRDIKPANVLREERSRRIKIADFGVARLASPEGAVTQPGTAVGSFVYASPEQLAGEPDTRSDMYSLGCTLYFLLAGHGPFAADAPLPDILHAKTRKPPVVSGGAATAAFVAQLMDPKPKRRFDTWDALLEVVNGLLIQER